MRRLLAAAALAALPVSAAAQGYESRCSPPDILTIADDGPGRAIVFYSNSVNKRSRNLDLVLESENGIAVRVVITVGASTDGYKEQIMLYPKEAMMMAFPPEGLLEDGESHEFVIQGGVS